MTPYPNERAHAREQHAAEMAAREDARTKVHAGPVPIREPSDRERLAGFLRNFISQLEVYGYGSVEFERVRVVVNSELERVEGCKAN